MSDVTPASATTAPTGTGTPPVVQGTPITAAAAQTAVTKKILTTLPAKLPRSDIVAFIICFVLVALMLWKAGAKGAIGLSFKPDVASSILPLLGGFLLVSLFVERVIEVFVSIWSDQQTVVHQQNLDYWQTRRGRLQRDVQNLIAERDGTPGPDEARKARIDALLQAKRSAIEEAEVNEDIEAKALLPFEARTRKITTWFGLAVGTFTAAVGFRFLHQIVDITPMYKPSEKIISEQFGWFVAADVLLTGTVLAGGSKLIHEIFAVYESFMKSAQKSLSDKSKSQ